MFIEFIKKFLTHPRLAEGSAWVRRSFSTGDILLTEGAVGQSLFVVEKGRLSVLGRVQHPDQPSVEVTLMELITGHVFGESSLIDAYPSIATVRAVTDGSVIEINGATLSVYLDDNPEQGYLFFKYLLAESLDNLAKTKGGVVDLAMIGLRSHVAVKTGS
ncbi:MAG TPA: cyclic nucleotide-binding domain-containing protein [Lamprocystis sp. (in: g-proteobacteria)]|nr:cyclic nucleotide-binding domain-containing protein [Lamprocystis sp. (in: g-proteobacteria)]